MASQAPDMALLMVMNSNSRSGVRPGVRCKGSGVRSDGASRCKTATHPTHEAMRVRVSVRVKVRHRSVPSLLYLCDLGRSIVSNATRFLPSFSLAARAWNFRSNPLILPPAVCQR